MSSVNLSRLGLSATLARLSKRRQYSRAEVRTSLVPYVLAGQVRRYGLRTQRLTRALTLEADSLRTATNLPSLDVMVASSAADIVFLPRLIEAVYGGSRNPVANIEVVVPSASVDDARRSVGTMATIHDEADLVPCEVRSKLPTLFPRRVGWVTQQLVKVSYVAASRARAVLVLDADTLLLHPRVWIASSGTQVLTPTLEWHQPYYDALEVLSEGRWMSPRDSFVSHHMLMQPACLRDILASLGVATAGGLLESLGPTLGDKQQSPFSLDYELYAQGMLNVHPDMVVMAKWSNVAIPRSGLASAWNDVASKYMSVSAHAYLDTA